MLVCAFFFFYTGVERVNLQSHCLISSVLILRQISHKRLDFSWRAQRFRSSILNPIHTWSLSKHNFLSSKCCIFNDPYPYSSGDLKKMHEAIIKRFLLFFLLINCMFSYLYNVLGAMRTTSDKIIKQMLVRAGNFSKNR